MLHNISPAKADTYLNMCYILKVYSLKVVACLIVEKYSQTRETLQNWGRQDRQ